MIPEVPEGMELHKFYGQPIRLPKSEDGEPLVGKTPYTQRMIDRLNELVAERDHKLILETLKREEKERERIGYLGLAF